MYYDKITSVRRFSLLVGLAILIVSCSSESTEGQLVGRWSMDKVLQNDQNVTAEHNPENDRWIQFNSDNTFTSGGTPFGENTPAF